MKKQILLFIFTFFSVYVSYACSCQGPRNFCSTLNTQDFSRQNGLIIRGIKIDQDTMQTSRLPLPFMRVKILDRLLGNLTNDTIIVFGGDGLNCNVSLTPFADNDTLILAFDVARDSMDLSACGQYYLQIKNGNVTGNILSSSVQESMAYDSFLTFLKTAPCLTADIIEDQKINNSITVAPNPGTGAFNLIINQAVKNAEIKIYNIEGKIIFSDRISADANKPYPIDLINQPDSLYFIKLTGSSYEMNTKIVKN